MFAHPCRRDFLYGLGATLGTAALNSLLAGEEKRASSPLAPKISTVMALQTWSSRVQRSRVTLEEMQFLARSLLR